jgi:hypothetical protein
MCIGNNINDKLFTRLGMKYILVDRNLDVNKYTNENVTCLRQCSTIEMVNHLAYAMYVYVSESNSHVDHTMSASIPLALDSLCTLIMPERMNQYYKLESAMSVDGDLDIIDTDQQIERVNHDLERMLSRRNDVLSEKVDYLSTDHKNTVIMIEPRFLSDVVSIMNEYYRFLGNNWHYVFYCGKGTSEKWKKCKFDMNIELRELHTNNFTEPSQYSDFMKQRSLWESLYGDYVLTVQVDTWPMNTIPIETFINLNQSYIGGFMDHHWNEMVRDKMKVKYCNGNGGLSLRKRMDMIRVIDTYPPKPSYKSSESLETDAEDVYFYMGCYRLGLRIGDDIVSSHFALHTSPKEKWFAIHKPTPTVAQFLNNAYPHLKNMNPYLKL